MAPEDWDKYVKRLGIFLNGKTIPNANPRGEPVLDDSFYIIFNAEEQAQDFILPNREWGEKWVKEFDTADCFTDTKPQVHPQDKVKVEGRNVMVLRCVS